MRRKIGGLLFVLAMAATGCTTTSASADTPQPAGPTPSSIALQVCSKKAITEINDVLGEQAAVSVPSWMQEQHLYSCDYRYETGSMALSVKELSSWPQTMAHFASLAKQLHRTTAIYGLGQGAFRARNGSVVVRKDWKILVVDVSGLPREFGLPETDVAAAGLSVADVILGCWNGD
jgi:hypothetical protein